MNPLHIYAIALCALAMFVACYFAFRCGVQRGQDIQRVKDIIELWSQLPKRDARGRFKAKEKRGLAA